MNTEEKNKIDFCALQCTSIKDGFAVRVGDMYQISKHIGSYEDMRRIFEVHTKYELDRNNYTSMDLAIVVTHNYFYNILESLRNGTTELSGEYLKLVERVFIRACRKGCFSIAEFLIEKGVNIHARSDKGFKLACKNGHIDIVRLLVERGVCVLADRGAGFVLACGSGNIDLIKFLLEECADELIHGHYISDGIIRACGFGDLGIVKFLMRSTPLFRRYSAGLMEACRKGHVDIFEFLNEHRLSCRNKTDEWFYFYNSFFIIACQKGHVNIVEFFYRHLLFISEIEERLCIEYGFIQACKYGHLDIVKFLIGNVANFDATFVKSYEVARKNSHSHIMDFLRKKRKEKKKEKCGYVVRASL